jgi:hypothetical protein
MSLYVPYYRPYNKHNTNIHASGGIFFFFCLSGVFPLWSIFVLFNPFCPSCHLCSILLSVQQHNTNIHAPGGIRTRNPSKRAAADPRLRPHGHWASPPSIYWNKQSVALCRGLTVYNVAWGRKTTADSDGITVWKVAVAYLKILCHHSYGENEATNNVKECNPVRWPELQPGVSRIQS